MIVERSPGRWFVLSSKGDAWYFVKRWGETDMTCNCAAGINNMPCRHIREVRAA